jgi:hypothetical protein
MQVKYLSQGFVRNASMSMFPRDKEFRHVPVNGASAV